MRVLLGPRRPSSPGARVTASELESLYAFPAGRRWVRANFVSTLDGSAVGPDGRSGTINTPADNRVFALQRRLTDAVLVGAGTVRAEGYERVTPVRGRQVPPALVVVSASGRVPEGLRTPTEGRGAGLFVTCASAGTRRIEQARSVLGVESVLVAGEERVDLAVALDALADRGLRHVLCEGGPSLFGAALAAGVVDELALTLSPLLVGGDGTRVTVGAPLGAPAGLAATPRLLLEEAGTMLGLWRVSRP
ncbi:dihydrofolate reductase family protein [Oryzobacter telluris]|uniref:dihydrofolate reductase family protein n=1 Tax=Oryzobacter telluris TaxID=3149179 RepID=UPI00370D6B8D